MADMMTFPNTVEEFMEQYKIVDTEEVYTNGADLVPIFRMMQWFEHVSATDTISRQAAIDGINKLMEIHFDRKIVLKKARDVVEQLPPAQPEIIRCKDCKFNPKYEWFRCPMSQLSEKQRPETAWCWKAERRTDGID